MRHSMTRISRFNPRVREGRDSVVFVAFMFALFQSTRP